MLFKILMSHESFTFLIGESVELLKSEDFVLDFLRARDTDLSGKCCFPSLYHNRAIKAGFLIIKAYEQKVQHVHPCLALETDALQLWGLPEAARGQPGGWSPTCGHCSSFESQVVPGLGHKSLALWCS